MDCPPGSSVHGILQARILEWVATSSVSQNLLKFMSPLPASNPRKQFASDSHSQSGYICLNQRALFTFSSLPLCFHIFRCFLLIPCVWSKKIYLIVNFTNLTWSWFSKYAAQLSEQKNDKKKKYPYQNFFSKKDSFRKIYSGQLLHLSDSAVFADFANLCSLSMMLFTYPFIYSWKK